MSKIFEIKEIAQIYAFLLIEHGGILKLVIVYSDGGGYQAAKFFKKLKKTF